MKRIDRMPGVSNALLTLAITALIVSTVSAQAASASEAVAERSTGAPKICK